MDDVTLYISYNPDIITISVTQTVEDVSLSVTETVDNVTLTVSEALQGDRGIQGPAGTATTVSSTITFANESNYEEVSVAYPSALSTNKVLVDIASGHEEAGIQGLKLGLVSITEGVGYTIYGANTEGMTGTYNITLLIF